MVERNIGEYNFTTAHCTSVEQSKKLIELGLKYETADWYYYAQQRFDGNDYVCTGKIFSNPIKDENDKEHFTYLHTTFGDEVGENDTPYVLPAWSLSRLYDILPEKIKLNDEDLAEDFNIAYLEINKCEVIYDDFMIKTYNFRNKDDVYNGIIDAIEWLINNNYFNKKILKDE